MTQRPRRQIAQSHRLAGLISVPVAVGIRIGGTGGVDVALNSTRQQVLSPDCFTELGIDVRSKSIVVVKSTEHSRAGIDKTASATVYCLATRSPNGDWAQRPCRHLRRPIWPLDPLDALSAGDCEVS